MTGNGQPQDQERITFHTSAPAVYDSFSTRTDAIAGQDQINGEPVRLVSCEQRDYDWQTARYSSGLCRFSTERTPTTMYERFGDWKMYDVPLDPPTPPSNATQEEEEGEEWDSD